MNLTNTVIHHRFDSAKPILTGVLIDKWHCGDSHLVQKFFLIKLNIHLPKITLFMIQTPQTYSMSNGDEVNPDRVTL